MEEEMFRNYAQSIITSLLFSFSGDRHVICDGISQFTPGSFFSRDGHVICDGHFIARSSLLFNGDGHTIYDGQAFNARSSPLSGDGHIIYDRTSSLSEGQRQLFSRHTRRIASAVRQVEYSKLAICSCRQASTFSRGIEPPPSVSCLSGGGYLQDIELHVFTCQLAVGEGAWQSSEVEAIYG